MQEPIHSHGSQTSLSNERKDEETLWIVDGVAAVLERMQHAFVDLCEELAAIKEDSLE